MFSGLLVVNLSAIEKAFSKYSDELRYISHTQVVHRTFVGGRNCRRHHIGALLGRKDLQDVSLRPALPHSAP